MCTSGVFYGGKTAMLFAALHPNLAHKLIVADIAPRYPVHHDAILEGLSSLDFSRIKRENKQTRNYRNTLVTRIRQFY